MIVPREPYDGLRWSDWPRYRPKNLSQLPLLARAQTKKTRISIVWLRDVLRTVPRQMVPLPATGA